MLPIKMSSVPTSNLTARAIKSGLDTAVMGCRVRSYATVSSTMDATRRLAESGAAEGTVVVPVSDVWYLSPGFGEFRVRFSFHSNGTNLFPSNQKRGG